MGTTSTPSVSTDTIFTTREYSASQFGTPTYPDATTAKRQILDNDDGTFTIQFLTEDEDISPISSTISDDVDITINSAEVQAYQVTKPEIQVLLLLHQRIRLQQIQEAKKLLLGGVEYTIAPGSDGVAIETASDVANFFCKCSFG